MMAEAFWTYDIATYDCCNPNYEETLLEVCLEYFDTKGRSSVLQTLEREIIRAATNDDVNASYGSCNLKIHANVTRSPGMS